MTKKEFVYDAFISYRNVSADRKRALKVLEELESIGVRLAIDERDFQANRTFVQEMERCVVESRYTLAIVTSEYLRSGNTIEEAVLSKVLGMDELKDRLVPLKFEDVQLPTWIHSIVGVDFTKTHPFVDPMDKVKSLFSGQAAH